VNTCISRACFAIFTLALIMLLAGCTSQTAGRAKTRLAPDSQAQLNALQTPQGVDPAVFRQLKDELARQLSLRRKTASSPPIGVENTPANVHFTDNGGGSFTLEWDYRNIGDYNQDKVVDVADITPLAIHFGHDPGTDGLDIVLHPSGVGKVGVGDITPLAQHFGTFCTGYSIRSDVSETGYFSTVVGQMYMSEATGGTDGWKHFAYTFNPDPTLWYRIHSWDEHGGLPGEPCAPLMSGAVIPAPVVNSVSPLAGGAREELTMTADVTGVVTNWAWDFGGGATPNTSTDASPVITLKGRGDYSASVTVSNPFGSDTYNFQLIVADKWYVSKIIDGPGYGRAVSAAFVGSPVGKACAAFSNDNDGSIMYARSTAVEFPTLTSDWIYMVADNANVYTGDISLAPLNTSEPGILAFTGDKAELINSSEIEPSSGAPWTASDITTNLTGNTGSLNVLQGTLTATLNYSSALYYFEAGPSYPTGPADWTSFVVDASGVVNLGADAVTVQNPMNTNIYTLYRDSTSEKLKLAWVDYYSRYLPASWTKLEVASGGAPGLWGGLAFDRAGSMLALFTQGGSYDSLQSAYSDDTPAIPLDLSITELLNINTTIFDVNQGMSTGFITNDRWVFALRIPDESELAFLYSPFAAGTPPGPSWWSVPIDQPASPDTITGGNAMIIDSGGLFIAVFYGRSDGMYCAVLPLR
jgi:PKD repeat protein